MSENTTFQNGHAVSASLESPAPGRPEASVAPGKPSPDGQGLVWNHEWSVRHRPLAVIAQEYSAEPQAVLDAVRHGERWLRRELFEDAAGLRTRQSLALEQASASTLSLWHQSSDPRYLAEARKLLQDLRKIWGIESPQAADASDPEFEGLMRVAGQNRADALRAQAASFMHLADRLEADPATGEATAIVNPATC